MQPLPQTARLAPVVHGTETLPEDDPAEVFHEASKLSPSCLARQMRGAQRLERNADLRAATLHAGRRNRHLPRVPLPPPAALSAPLGELLRSRRSARSFAPAPINLTELATLLDSAYGVSRVDEVSAGSFARRTVPSAGALYPLELYVLAARVDGLEPGLYHFDPFAAELERLPVAAAAERLARAAIYRDAFEQSAATVLVTAVFWRTRFKYALRGYRFALLEAGHAMQNLVLAAGACGLAALPVGGFFDRGVDDLLDLDGVDESTLYLAHVGKVVA